MLNMYEHKKDSWMREQGKRINQYLLLFAFLLLTFTVCSSLYTKYAEAAGAIGKVTQIEGRVDILREGKLPAAPARIGDSVFVKDVIRTKSGSKAEITFNDATILKVAQRSRIDISEYIADSGVSKAVIYMPRGKVMANVSKTAVSYIANSPKANKFEIHTPNAVAGVRGTDFFVFNNANSTGVLVAEGKVETYNPKFPDVKVNVMAGQITNVADNKPPTTPKSATDIEIKGHEKDVTPAKPKKKAEGAKEGETTTASGQSASATETGSATESGSTAESGSTTESGSAESQEIFGYSSPDESTSTDSALPEGGLAFQQPITPPSTETILKGTIVAVTVKDTTAPVTVKDTTAPVITITSSASPEAGNFTAGSFSISSNEAATYSYSLDGGVWTTSTGSTLTISGLTEGPHTLDIKATDSAGNVSSNTVSFSPSRYSLSGNFWGCIGNVTGSVSGEVAGISGQNWGGWNMTMAGTGNTTPNATWTLYAGGSSSDATYTDGRNNGWWIEIAPGTSDYSQKTLTGISTFRYLSYDRIGKGTGALTGSYVPDPYGYYSSYSLTDKGRGTYTETLLAWSAKINDIYGLYNGITSVGDTQGALAGGILSPWSGTTSLTLMGPYAYSTYIYSPPSLWTAPIVSYNKKNSTYTTYDGGTFRALPGGIWKDGKIDAAVYGLYIDPLGNAGILKGSLTGSYYPEISKFEADGTWTPTVLATGLNPLSSWSFVPDISFTSFSYASGEFSSGVAINGSNAKGSKYSIPGQTWGIEQILTAGSYSGATSDTWNFSFKKVSLYYIMGTQTQGTQWSNGVLAGKTYGYGADINIPGGTMTWISIGETRGTFDPVAFTWQAVQTGAWLETNKFLAMTADPAGQAKLAQLNIPAVEVGRANLSGSGNNLTVNMNDVIFFAPNNGQAPGIWATGNVNGTYSAAPHYGTPVTLAGNGLTASFTPQMWDAPNNKWMATVSGNGTYTGTGTMNNTTVQMDGAAAGIINSGSTFSGTAAGTAK